MSDQKGNLNQVVFKWPNAYGTENSWPPRFIAMDHYNDMESWIAQMKVGYIENITVLLAAVKIHKKIQPFPLNPWVK